MRYLAILLPALLTSCSPASDGRSKGPAIDRLCMALPGEKTSITPAPSGKTYFPTAFGKPAQVCNYKGYPECFATISSVEMDWYPQIWDAADEPSLYDRSREPRPQGRTTLRFTWLPTFDHPVIVRLERQGGKVELIAKQLSGEGGYEPGKAGLSVTRSLSDAEVRQLNTILSRTAVLDQRATECDGGLDGSQWIVESVDDEGYRFINRWSPEKGPVRTFGDFALDLTGWKLDKY